MPLPVTSIVVGETTAQIIVMKDRTTRPARTKSWMFTRSLEAILYGPRETSNGALLKLLGRISMSKSTLTLTSRSVGDGVVEQAEWDQIISLFRSTLDGTENPRKAKNVALIPTSVASAAAQSYGRNPHTVALLKGISSVPRQWALLEEKEELAQNNEMDLLLEEKIEEDADLEFLDMDLAVYELYSHARTHTHTHIHIQN